MVWKRRRSALAAEAERTFSSGFVLVKEDNQLVVAVGGDLDQRVNVASVSKALSSLAPVAAVVPAVRPAPLVRRLRAYTVAATAHGIQREFLAVGEDIAIACARAQEGLEAREDGPWLIDTVKLVGEAFG